MKRHTIGYLLYPGFNEADLVSMQAVLGIHPLNKPILVAPSSDPVAGEKGMVFVPDVTLAACPALDVLVIGGMPEPILNDTEILQFVTTRSEQANYVVGGATGVRLLARSGVLRGIKATADDGSTALLEKDGAVPVYDRTAVVDGKFHTGGACTGLIEAAFIVLGKLRGQGFAKFAELSLEYDPHPQFGDEQISLGSIADIQLEKPPAIAVVMPDGAYLPDFMGAMEVFTSLPGATLHVVSDTLSPSQCLLGPKIVPSITYEDCPQVDMVIIGATLPGQLKNEALLKFIQRQNTHAKSMVSVCAGTLVFAAAGIIEGRTVTSNYHHTPLLAPLGSTPSGTETVVDGKYYSAGPAIGSYEVGLRAVADLYGEDVARFIEQKILQFDPKPIFNTGSREKAGKLMTWLSMAIVSPSLPVYLLAGRRGKRLASS